MKTKDRSNLQFLIYHITLLLKDSNLCLPEIEKCVNTYNLTFIIKYGYDGTSDQVRFKQKFSDTDSAYKNIFTISMVPLCLKIIWKFETI